jgi:hypothetical protein
MKNNLSVNVVVGNCDSSRDMLYVACTALKGPPDSWLNR